MELPIIDAITNEEPVSEKTRTLGTISRLLSACVFCFDDRNQISVGKYVWIDLKYVFPRMGNTPNNFALRCVFGEPRTAS